jgi:ATP-dependent Clp protease protease subunit
VNDEVANRLCAQILLLAAEDGEKDINLYINSPGGSISAGMAIYDTMVLAPCDIATYAMGMAASMGEFLLAAGTKGKRYALPNSDIMIHQVSGGAQGTASDVERTVEFMFKLKKRLIHILAQHTGKSDEQVKVDSDRDYYMTADEAKAYGLVDEVVKSRKEIEIPAAVAEAAAGAAESHPA